MTETRSSVAQQPEVALERLRAQQVEEALVQQLAEANARMSDLERTAANQLATAATELTALTVAEAERAAAAESALIFDAIESSGTCAARHAAEETRAQTAESILRGEIDSLKSFAQASDNRSVDFDRPLHWLQRNWWVVSIIIVVNAVVTELLMHLR